MKEYCEYCKKTHEDNNWRGWVENNEVAHACSKWFKPQSVEIVPESVKKDREENAKSMIQPWRSGEPSAEFIEAYPKQAEKMFTARERMTAKPTWKDSLPTNWRKSR